MLRIHDVFLKEEEIAVSSTFSLELHDSQNGLPEQSGFSSFFVFLSSWVTYGCVGLELGNIPKCPTSTG